MQKSGPLGPLSKRGEKVGSSGKARRGGLGAVSLYETIKEMSR